MKSKSGFSLNRRNFLKVSATGLVSTGLFPALKVLSPDEQQQIPQIQDFRILGRTGFKISSISIGSSNKQENFHETLLKTGMNYFDTSPEYGNEITVGRAISKVDRNSVFVTGKFYPRVFTAADLSSVIPYTKDDVLRSFQKTLENLNTDHVDCYMLQGAASSKMVKDKAFHEAFKQLKREGKVRFCGIACHGSYWLDEPKETMEQICQTAIDDNRIDIIMLVYNFLQYDEGERILVECNKNRI